MEKNQVKMSNSTYIKSFIFFSMSLVFLSMYAIISSLDLFGTIISDIKLNIGRTHMFLLCNGILIIIVRGSSSPSSSSSQVVTVELDTQWMVKEVSNESNAQHFAVVSKNMVVKEVEVDCDQCSDDYENDHDNRVVDEDEGEDTEELHRRCEDFIRRTKQEIVLETRYDHGLARLSSN